MFIAPYYSFLLFHIYYTTIPAPCQVFRRCNYFTSSYARAAYYL